MTKTICRYPQYQCCGDAHCPLFRSCSKNPITARKGMNYGFESARTAERRTEQEKELHRRRYNYYNRFFGDLREKRRAYHKKWYQENRNQILRSRRKPVSHSLTKLQRAVCSGENCDDCPYDDCIIPIPEDRSQYYFLYYSVFRKQILRQKASYRVLHREQLSNCEKIRNYRKRGYLMSHCILVQTNNPDLLDPIGTEGLAHIPGGDSMITIADVLDKISSVSSIDISIPEVYVPEINLSFNAA